MVVRCCDVAVISPLAAAFVDFVHARASYINGGGREVKWLSELRIVTVFGGVTLARPVNDTYDGRGSVEVFSDTGDWPLDEDTVDFELVAAECEIGEDELKFFVVAVERCCLKDWARMVGAGTVR